MDRPINIILDGPPSAVAGRFVEIEDDLGNGVGIAADWVERSDGLWSLRIVPVDLQDEPFFEGLDKLDELLDEANADPGDVKLKPPVPEDPALPIKTRQVPSEYDMPHNGRGDPNLPGSRSHG